MANETSKVSPGTGSSISFVSQPAFRQQPDLPAVLSRPIWKKVLSGVAEAPRAGIEYVQSKLITEPRLSNPDLLKQDKHLLSEYLRMKSDGENVEGIKNTIRERYAELYKEAASSYTGREDISWIQRNLSAFDYAVESLGVFDEAQMKSISENIYSQELTDADKALLQDYRNDKSDGNKEKVLGRIAEYSEKQLSSVWGTPEKRDLVLRANAFSVMALDAGIPIGDLIGASAIDSKEILEKYSDMVAIDIAAGDAVLTPEKYDDVFSLFGLAGVYEPAVQELYCLLEQDNVNVKEISDVSSMLASLRKNYEACGGDPAQLDAIERNVRGSEPLNDSSERENNIKVFTPEQLPQDIKVELSRVLDEGEDSLTGMDLVRENVQRIIVTSDMPHDKTTRLFMGEGAGGLYAGNGIIILRECDDARQTASTLFHEAKHAKWERDLRVPLDVRKQPALNEGNAYAYGHLADLQAGLYTGQDILARSVAEMIGTYDFKEPAEEIKKLDLSVYPTRTPAYVRDSLVLPLIQSASIPVSKDEVKMLGSYLKDNANVCALNGEGGFVFLPSSMSSEQFESLIRTLPSREDEISDQFMKHLNIKSAMDSIATSLITSEIDMAALSGDIASAMERTGRTELREQIGNLYAADLPYRDVGVMLGMLLSEGSDIKASDFPSIYSFLLKGVDEKYGSGTLEQNISLFRDDASTGLGIKPEEISDIMILRLACERQPININNRKAMLYVYDRAGEPTGKVLQSGSRFNETLDAIITIGSDMLCRIRYSEGDGYGYGYIKVPKQE